MVLTQISEDIWQCDECGKTMKWWSNFEQHHFKKCEGK